MPSTTTRPAPVIEHLTRTLHRLRRALRVRPSEWWLVVQMLALLVRLTYWQHRLPLPELMARFEQAPVEEPHPPLRRFVRLTTTLMRAVYRRDYCMKRSLLLFYFLSRWGYEPVVHFGAKIEDGRLTGHAWVEVQGYPLAERADPTVTYRTTYTYPS